MNFFGKVFSGFGHVCAWLIHTALPAAKTVAQDVNAVASSPLGTLIATAAGAEGIAIQSGIEAISGSVVAAVDSAGVSLADLESHIQTEGLKVVFDPKSAADLLALYKLLKGQTVGLAPVPAAGSPAPAA